MNDPTRSTRRQALHMGLAMSAGLSMPMLGNAQVSQLAERPNPANFESGDLVWPKPPGAFIPYAGTPPEGLVVEALEAREDEWNEQRVQFVRDARAQANEMNPEERAYMLRLANEVEAMSYTRFFHEYAAGVTPSDFQAYGVGNIAYVGHVGLIEVDADTKTPWVVEAVFGKNLACTSCVQRVRYADWLRSRGNVLVWQGRLRNLNAVQRASVVAVARQHVNKPYRFFNFNLADDRGFYCSKLVWYAVMKATGIAIDGNSQVRRLFWFSPLQAMKAKAQVELISSPGNYRNV